MTIRCARCNRPLLNPVIVAGMRMGAVCAAAVAGAKPKRAKRVLVADVQQVVDPRQIDMFQEMRA